MYLSLRAEKGQKQNGQERRQAEPQIRRDRQPGMDPAQGAQKVVVQPQGQTQGPGAEELQRLGLEGVRHQPSRRRRKPPSGRACS